MKTLNQRDHFNRFVVNAQQDGNIFTDKQGYRFTLGEGEIGDPIGSPETDSPMATVEELKTMGVVGIYKTEEGRHLLHYLPGRN